MGLQFLERIGGPKGTAEIYEYEPDGIDRFVDAVAHVPNKYMLRFNGKPVGHYDDLDEARSEANERTGNNDAS